MPTLEEKSEDTSSPLLLRQLFYGPEKTRKTWLAGTAAEAGFNVIVLDADHGYHILTKQLSTAAKKRLFLVESRDSFKEAKAAMFIADFLKRGTVTYKENPIEIINLSSKIDETCKTLSVAKHLNQNTVLVLDSYTALVRSIFLRYSIEQKIDLTDPSKGDRDGYAWAGGLATWFLDKLCALPCHVIVVAHKTVYEKYKTVKENGKLKQVPDWSRVQIKSTSGPHALTIGDKFTDILAFENVSASMTKISTRADKDVMGGSRIIPPNIYKWEDLTWDKICGYADIPLPPKDLPFNDYTAVIPKPIVGGGNIEHKENSTAKVSTGLKGLKGLQGLGKNKG